MRVNVAAITARISHLSFRIRKVYRKLPFLYRSRIRDYTLLSVLLVILFTYRDGSSEPGKEIIMKAFNNHFGMVVSTIIAIVLSFLLSEFAISWDHIPWTVPRAIQNWGTCYLIITLTGWIFPLPKWSFALCRKWHIKEGTPAHGLIENLVATLFFNTSATFVLSAVNMFGNPDVEAAVAAGAAPSVASLLFRSACAEWPIMFAVSYVIALIITKFAIAAASRAAKINFDNEVMRQQGLGVNAANRPAAGIPQEHE